ncbi:MAG: protein-glutamate O-methyltransferase CheR [Synergistaceae bacterium]|jgi:chemotaxis protein methyltransferase CheR|nr:protein-glutamate O-methyltransferase CheR [Synergistaceae bacterium]
MEEKNVYDSPEYDDFKHKLRKIIGLDLNSYKNQIHRRVHMLRDRWGVKTYDEYFTVLKTDDKKLREFLDHLTINVSEFFRNDKQWWKLRDQLIPELVKKRGSKRIKLWSAGCATGEEPYSLAILSTVCGLDSSTPVLACDIDKGALAVAQRGVYLKRQLLSAPPDYLAKYFTTADRGETYQIAPDIKRRVTFKSFNMIDDVFGTGFDLILCRNVVIYFTAETKARLYQKFYDALAPGGYFLVGSTEQIYEYRKIGFENAGPFLYTRKAG